MTMWHCRYSPKGKSEGGGSGSLVLGSNATALGGYFAIWGLCPSMPENTPPYMSAYPKTQDPRPQYASRGVRSEPRGVARVGLHPRCRAPRTSRRSPPSQRASIRAGLGRNGGSARGCKTGFEEGPVITFGNKCGNGVLPRVFLAKKNTQRLSPLETL